MWNSLKRLGLGLSLIAIAAAVLLWSDAGRRRRSPTAVGPRVAVVQHASQGAIDDGVAGMLDGLARNGFVDGQTISLRRYNAEGDLGTANAIAKEVTSGAYDLVLTVTTLSLQSVASVNRDARINHVFALVADPAGAGVGISRDDPLRHPPYMAGYGNMQPVAATMKLARRVFPGLVKVGVVWNPAEANSEASLELARPVCAELGIELLEATAENTAAVGEAAAALTARGVQALWVGADVTALTALPSIVNAAQRARIPVFTSIPGSVRQGSLFDVGADYHEVGALAGDLASRVLTGTSPATVPVINLVPENVSINPQALAGLKDPWRFPDDVVSAAGKAKAVGAPVTPPAAKSYEIGVVYFAPDPGADACMQGFFDGLGALGIVEGKNLTVRRVHAQAEIANLPALLQDFDSRGLDLIVTLTTPALTAASSVVKNTPVVFTFVYDPIAAGAGTTMTDHLPGVTGVGSFPPIDATVDMIQHLLPEAKVIGTIYNSSEANSRKVVGVARDVFAARGLDLEEVTVTNPSETFEAAQALVARGVQAFWITGDNTVTQAIDAVVKVANDAGLAIINNDPELVARGTLACVGIGFYRSGYEAARLAARVLAGESPAGIPMEDIAEQTVVLNRVAAERLGLRFPADLLESADAIVDQSGSHPRQPPTAGASAGAAARPAKTWKIAMLEFVDVPDSEDAQRGVRDGLAQAGLVDGRDYTVRVRNAQGDMATLTTLVDAALGDGADLLVTLSTPTLQAALQRARDVPIVFTFSADPIGAGAGRSNDDHLPNVTGVPTLGPYDQLADVVRECLPQARRIGALVVPAEVNSVHNRAMMAEAAAARGMELVAVPVNTSTDIADAALSLCTQQIDAIAQVGSNLTTVAFASIAQAADRARVPLFGTLSGNIRDGAAVVVARDFYDAGVQTGHMAARVVRGARPAEMPFEPVTATRLLVNLDAARKQGLAVPASLVQRAQAVVGQR